MSKKYPFYKQPHARDCGAVCLRMAAEYYGRFYTTEYLRSLANQQREGVTLLDISNAAESIGMHTIGAEIPYARLIDDIPLPGIAHYKGNHFVVVYEATKTGVTIADPDLDRVMTIPVKDFLNNWVEMDSWHEDGVVLLMEPTAAFFSNEIEATEVKAKSEIRSSIFEHKQLLWFLGSSIFFGLLLTATLPFLLEMAVSEGVRHQNIGLLKRIFALWFILFLCKTGMDFVKRYTQFHIGSRVHVKLVTTFMMRALQSPLKFFETKMSEDVLQTIFDNQKVLRFLSGQGVPMIFGSLLLLLFSLILLVFDWRFFAVFWGFAIVQGLVIWLFVQKRYHLNYQRHEFIGQYYDEVSDLVRGVKDIKLNNAEKARRWKWERLEAHRHRLDKAQAKTNEIFLQIPYYLSELRDIIIIYLAILAVYKNEMGAGVLMATVFVLLQLNNPLKMIIDFWLGWGEIKTSIERMNDVHALSTKIGSAIKIETLPEKAVIKGENVSFQYSSGNSPKVLQNLDFTIPYGRTTAIIGPNGSGKSTLLNLILNTLSPDEGLIKLGDLNLSDIQTSTWLSACGVVPQDGYIFSDSIAVNIALGEQVINTKRLLAAARIAHIMPFVERLNEGFNTHIGEGGMGLSKGQQQSILIARAVYKNPDYLFLDEATNDLDSETEKRVLQNIMAAFRSKTVVIIASRMNLPVKFDNVIPISKPRNHPPSTTDIFNEKWGGSRVSEWLDG